MVSAAVVRISRPVRPACWADASRRAPTSRPGLGRSANRTPLMVAVAGGGARDPPSVDGRGAGRRGGQTHHYAHGGGLAGAVRAEEAGDATGPGGEGDGVDGGEAGVPPGQ